MVTCPPYNRSNNGAPSAKPRRAPRMLPLALADVEAVSMFHFYTIDKRRAHISGRAWRRTRRCASARTGTPSTTRRPAARGRARRASCAGSARSCATSNCAGSWPRARARSARARPRAAAWARGGCATRCRAVTRARPRAAARAGLSRVLWARRTHSRRSRGVILREATAQTQLPF